MATQDQSLPVGAGLPAPTDTRPEAIKAIPVRHWGRWISAAVVIYIVVALLYSFIKSPNTDWSVVGNYLFKPLVLRGVLLTIELTFVCMIVGAVGGTILAVMRLSENPVLSTIAWAYIWFFRGTPVLCADHPVGQHRCALQPLLRRPAVHRTVARLDGHRSTRQPPASWWRSSPWA